MTQSNFDDVGEFHQKFGLDNVTNYLAGPRPNMEEFIEFRIKFLLEEVLELIEAAGYEVRTHGRESVNGDNLVLQRVSTPVDHGKMFDALIDEVYVALGTAHLLGYPWQEGWELVQEANMAKMRAKADGSDSLRGSSLDVVKPPGWTPPDIENLLESLGWRKNLSCSEVHPVTGNPCIVEGPHEDHQAMGTLRLQIFGDHLRSNE